jgi:heme-degrading monooxygenase HmoA
VPIYMSMQRVRFSSPDAYEKFKVVFSDTRHHLMKLPGFLHLTWWAHPDDPGWFNECSFWTSKKALYDWHMDTYHKHAKAWAANGAIMEDIITNFELVGTRLLRVCPCCNEVQDKPYELAQEQSVLREQCPKCGFHFPYLTEQPSSFAVFKDVPLEQLDAPSAGGDTATTGETKVEEPVDSRQPVQV